MREYIDTYLVTTGTSYNLQVWNRNPNTPSVQIDLKNGEALLANDVRFVLGKVNSEGILESIIIMTPAYIENTFGKFGKPTLKQQLIVSNKKRREIVETGSLVIDDTALSHDVIDFNHNPIASNVGLKDEPTKVFPISYIDKEITSKLLGQKLNSSFSTKQRGQQLERIVAYHLGYTQSQETLEGGYPDIRNQMLEIKVQDSPTIDLGKYSPQFEEQINQNFTTRTIRYLIALTDAASGSIDGIILCPGEDLGKHFSYITQGSFKCQRSIPMNFFKQYRGQVVYNP